MFTRQRLSFLVTRWTRGTRRTRALVATLLVVVLVAAVSLSNVGGAGSSRAAARPSIKAGAPYHNPVFARDFPDPSVLRVGADYYAYATTTGWEQPGRLFPILRSRDLVHWAYVADAFSGAPAWGGGDWWAPDVIASKGVYYMYYVGKGIDAGTHCIGVATASKPTGPFIHRAVIGCGDSHGRGYIDPAPLIDTDGKAYVYISVDDPRHNISVIPLKRDLLHAAGPRKRLFGVSQAWEHGANFTTVEGPFAVKHGKTNDLFYSGNDWQHDYAEGYATSSSPLGPFTKYRGNPVIHDALGVTGPGGGSVVRGPRGGWWLVYHAWTGGPGYDAGGVRNLRIDPITWTGDKIGVRGPTAANEPSP